LLGYIGVLSGMSSTLLGMTSIGVDLPDDTFGDESYAGQSFIFVSRYILQYSETVDDALSYIADVRRTCHLIMGIADGELNTARMIQYSHSKVNFFDDLNLQPSAEWHPRIPNVVYNGMDWLCPSFQYKLYQQITSQYGQITPESTIENISAVVKTGDVHMAVYDLTDNILYVANARGSHAQGPKPAYQRQFTKLDLNVEYARMKPSMN
jgi:isopenicillin-N N-acyltransferase-like protein